MYHVNGCHKQGATSSFTSLGTTRDNPWKPPELTIGPVTTPLSTESMDREGMSNVVEKTQNYIEKYLLLQLSMLTF